MLSISFAWTTDALLAGRKTCTRRSWSDDYAHQFIAAYYGEQVIWALNRGYRNGGTRIAVIRQVEKPVKQRTSLAPDSDFEAEGLAWMEEQGLKIRGLAPREFWETWKALD